MMKDAKQFSGEENHAITLAEAVTFIKQFRDHHGYEAAPGVFFDKTAVQAILDQPNAVGMRYYYGLDEIEQAKLVLVGTDARRNDLLAGEPLKVSMQNPPLTARGYFDRSHVQHEISLEKAADLTARFQEHLTTGQPKGGFFGRKSIQRLLDHPGCIGLRCYYGAKKNGTRAIVALCVDGFGTDLFYGPIAELSALCPPFCSDPNLLNHRSIAKASAML